MPTGTRFERQLEKQLKANADAMFRVELGDSHRHAFLKGMRDGLTTALSAYRNDAVANDDKDDI